MQKETVIYSLSSDDFQLWVNSENSQHAHFNCMQNWTPFSLGIYQTISYSVFFFLSLIFLNYIIHIYVVPIFRIFFWKLRETSYVFLHFSPIVMFMYSIRVHIQYFWLYENDETVLSIPYCTLTVLELWLWLYYYPRMLMFMFMFMLMLCYDAVVYDDEETPMVRK